MYNPPRIVLIFIIIALLIVSAGCAAKTNTDLIRPIQTPSTGTVSSGSTIPAAAVNFDNAAERDAFLAQFDTLAGKEMNDWDVPGMAVAVVKDGKIVFAKGYGVKKAGDPIR